MIDWLRPRAMLLAKAAARGEGSVCNVCVCDIACQGVAEESGEEAGHQRGEQMAWQGCPVTAAANAEAATDQGIAPRLQ